uniref:aldehyde dehydrogenase family protein n=1 Tax=Sphingorhabdus sp. TaxID=1902408 RepID=UPI00398379B9
MTDKTIKTINPLTEKVLETYSYMTDDEGLGVVQNSHDAFLAWRLKSLDERASVMSSIATELRKSRDEFAQLMTNEVGKL